jgi:hypothetical protein
LLFVIFDSMVDLTQHLVQEKEISVDISIPMANAKAIHSDVYWESILHWFLNNWPDYKNVGIFTSRPLVPMFPKVSKFLSLLLKSASLIVYCILIWQYTVCTGAHSCDEFCWEVDHSTSSTKSDIHHVNPGQFNVAWNSKEWTVTQRHSPHCWPTKNPHFPGTFHQESITPFIYLQFF